MMFVFLFPVFQLGALRAACRRAPMRVAAAGLACLHALVLAATARAPTAPRSRHAMPCGARRRSLQLARRTANMAARCALRTVHAGHPLTPTGYALLCATVAAAALVSLLCQPSTAASEPEHPLGLRPRFA
jgi:hypothetical protein